MPKVIFYFHIHQPFRLHVNGNDFFWDEINKEIFLKVADHSYLPAVKMFHDLMLSHPKFKITFGMSGTFLKQSELYLQKVIDDLHKMYKFGKSSNQIEFLEETYFHSLASLFKDEYKNEFKNQVTLHRNKMKEVFGSSPKCFVNTEMIYNDDIGNIVADMGFNSILCEAPSFGTNHGVISKSLFHLNGRKNISRDMVIIARNRQLSNKVAVDFAQNPFSAKEFLELVSQERAPVVLLAFNLEHIGEHIPGSKGIFDFWKEIPNALALFPNIECVTPRDVVAEFKDQDLPKLSLEGAQTTSWSIYQNGVKSWIGSSVQRELLNELEAYEEDTKKTQPTFIEKWRHLTATDHFAYINEDHGIFPITLGQFNPYGSIAHAAYLLTKNIERLKNDIHSFNIISKKDEVPVIIISPETARLPERGMGEFAKFISGKSGGLGEVISAICNGLVERKIPTHIITLDLSRRFKEESNLSEEEWMNMTFGLDPQNVHLISSGIFENKRNAYEGVSALTAAEFQKQIVNTTVKNIVSRTRGKAIIHTHDWMAGGIVPAFAKSRNLPVLHTIHNTHTGLIPAEYFYGLNLARINNHLYLQNDNGVSCIDAQATAIKNASQITVVGKKFLEEIVRDYFLDRAFIPYSVRQEIKFKYRNNSALVIPNGIAPQVYPENQVEHSEVERAGLAKILKTNMDLVSAKRANVEKLQRKLKMQVNPDATLFYWPSRLDSVQKGVELFEDIALRFIAEFPEVQIVVVGDPVSGTAHGQNIATIAGKSNGRIAYSRFNEDISMLAYAAASDVFGASLYEPFGQIDVVGNIYGATATNRDTGGYHDKIVPLFLKEWGGPQDVGNGVLFKDYDPNGLYWGMAQAVSNHRYFRANPDSWNRQMKRIMNEARKKWSLDSMIAGYITAYYNLQR